MRHLALLVFNLVALPALAAELPLTPAQTEGPYYPRRKPAETDADLTRIGSGPAARGEPLVIDGVLRDPTGQPIAGARVEIWQTDANGVYLHPDDPGTGRRDRAFQFYGEATTDAAGAFRFRTIMPAAYEGRPRHIHAKVRPPGGRVLTTQFYVAGDPLLASDGIARRLGPALERVTLKPARGADGAMAAAITVVVARR